MQPTARTSSDKTEACREAIKAAEWLSAFLLVLLQETFVLFSWGLDGFGPPMEISHTIQRILQFLQLLIETFIN